MVPLLQSEFTRPLLVSLLAPALVGQIQTSDCGAIDHMITLLQPLPPRNTAGLVVSALGASMIRNGSAQIASSSPMPWLRVLARSSPRVGTRDVRTGKVRVGMVLMGRSEEHTSELQSLMRSSYAVFCLQKKKK